MTLLIILYAVGVAANAFLAVSIWRDLESEGMLERVRKFALLTFVLLSFVTWLYAVVYSLVNMITSHFGGKKNETDIH